MALSAPMSNSLACATGHLHVTGDASTPGGKVLLCAAMLAFATHSPLALVQGNGACYDHGGFETLWILRLGTD
jgi:hypothetical protein